MPRKCAEGIACQFGLMKTVPDTRTRRTAEQKESRKRHADRIGHAALHRSRLPVIKMTCEADRKNPEAYPKLSLKKYSPTAAR